MWDSKLIDLLKIVNYVRAFDAEYELKFVDGCPKDIIYDMMLLRYLDASSESTYDHCFQVASFAIELRTLIGIFTCAILECIQLEGLEFCT